MSTATLSSRSLAPDLGRGIMLLLIALANGPWFLYGSASSASFAHPANPEGVDALWQAVSIITIDGRIYPLFALLFGYGIWQQYAKQAGAQTPEKQARALLQRRHAWMLVFGLVHAALLWYGDIIGAYGLVGLLVTWLFLRRSDRTIKVWCWIFGGFITLGALSSLAVGVLGALVPAFGAKLGLYDFNLPNPNATPNYLLSLVERTSAWSMVTLSQLLLLVVPLMVLLGIVAARRRMLDEPHLHIASLRRIAVLGISVAWLGGALSAAQQLGVLLPAEIGYSLAQFHTLTGLFGGAGYAALIGLIAARMKGSSGFATRAVTAVGKRSLTSYLLQSLLFAPVLCAWGLGLGAVLSSWQMALYSLAVWLVTVVVALLLERNGKRGPAEYLLRRLAYGKRTLAAPAAMSSTAA